MVRLPDVIATRIENLTTLDRITEPLAARVSSVLERTHLKDVLSGSWFGHPLHPLLTDLPIGSWTSAMLLDLVGGRRAEPAADVLVAAGIATAVPTAITGLSDWSDLAGADRRVGLVHATANSLALTLYTASLIARRRGRRTVGVLLGLAGGTAASAGGFLGGHLVYRRGAGVDHTAFDVATTGWTSVALADVPTEGSMTMVTVDGVDVMITRHQGSLCGLADRCTHQGGPLHEGELVDGRVRCPWHASEFRVDDGRVVRGPASAPQPAYEVVTEPGGVRLRRRSVEP